MRVRTGAFALCCLALTGCALPPSATTPYTDQATVLRQDLAQNKANIAEGALQKEMKGDPQLYALELGRIEQLSGDYQDSILQYKTIIDAFNAKATAPKIQITKIASKVFTSKYDNSRAYAPEPYEMVLVFQYQGMNYLAEGKPSDALVNFRQAATLQTYLNTEVLPKIQKKDPIPTTPTGAPTYAELLALTRAQTSLPNSLSNGVASFIAGLSFLDAGDLNAASLSMQNAEAALPVPLLQEEAVLTMQKSGMSPDVMAEKQKALGAPVSFPAQKKPEGTSPVFVMTEQGFIPLVQQALRKVPIPGTDDEANFIVPYYATTAPVSRSYDLVIDGKVPLLKGSFNLSLADLAAASLVERYPKIVNDATLSTNQSINTILYDISAVSSAEQALTQSYVPSPGESSDQLAAQIESAEDDLADAQSALADAVANLSAPHTTDVNIRSWSTLPEDIHIQKLELLPGNHTLVLLDDEKNTVMNCTFTSQQGSNGLVWINTQLPTPVCQQLL